MFTWPYFDEAGGKINDVNQAFPSTILRQGPGAILNQGQLGSVFQFDETTAIAISNATNTLKGCTVQLFRFKSNMTAAAAWGRPLFVSDLANYVVTTDAADATVELIGFALNAVTAGNMGYMVIHGYAPVIFGTVTKTTPVINDTVNWEFASSVGVGNVLADATAVLPLVAGRHLGRAFTAPATGVTSFVHLFRMLGFPHIGIRS